MKNTNNFYVELSTPKAKGGERDSFRPKMQDYQLTPIDNFDVNAYTFYRKNEVQAKSPWDEAHQVLDKLADKSVSYVEPEIDYDLYENQFLDTGVKAKSASNVFLERWVKPEGVENSFIWHLGDEFSQLKAAYEKVKSKRNKKKVRIAHIDTGVIMGHPAMPKNINWALAKSFIKGDKSNSVEDRDVKGLKNLTEVQGHGMGTIGILAGNKVGKKETCDEYEGFCGAIPDEKDGDIAEIIPIRIAETVALIRTRNFVKAVEYAIEIGCEVITMSMAGAPSRKWAKVVNKAYEKGIIMVTAAGNNWVKGGRRLLPKSVLYPARWDSVIAATGVCFNQMPYDFDIQHTVKPKSVGGEYMQGNYGPPAAMKSALAAYTPNLAWAVKQSESGSAFVRTGGGTSSATPQIAAAAALWIVYNRAYLETDAFKKEPWRKVEAAKKALFEKAGGDDKFMEYFGKGTLKAYDALMVRPLPHKLKKSKKASVFLFGFAELFGIMLGIKRKGEEAEEIARFGDPSHAMFLAEALQILHTEPDLQEYLKIDWEDSEAITNLSASQKNDIIDIMRKSGKASAALRGFLNKLNTSGGRANAAKYITQLFVAQQKGQAADADIQWVSKWLLQKGDKELLLSLKTTPLDLEVQGSLKYVLKHLLKNEVFTVELEERIAKMRMADTLGKLK